MGRQTRSPLDHTTALVRPIIEPSACAGVIVTYPSFFPSDPAPSMPHGFRSRRPVTVPDAFVITESTMYAWLPMSGAPPAGLLTPKVTDSCLARSVLIKFIKAAGLLDEKLLTLVLPRSL